MLCSKNLVLVHTYPKTESNRPRNKQSGHLIMTYYFKGTCNSKISSVSFEQIEKWVSYSFNITSSGWESVARFCLTRCRVSTYFVVQCCFGRWRCSMFCCPKWTSPQIPSLLGTWALETVSMDTKYQPRSCTVLAYF